MSQSWTPEISASALLEALFADAPVGLGVWDRELCFVRVNEPLALINGVAADAHLGRRPSEVLPLLGGELEGLLREVLESGEPLVDVEVSGETPAAVGVRRHWLAQYFPVRGSAGEISGVAALVVEVTGERDAELRADSAQRRSAFVDAELRALYAALPVGVAFLSPDLRYQRVNETLAQLNGRSIAEHVGATLEEVVGEHAGALREGLEGVMRTREPLELELRTPLPHDPSDVRALEATFFPVLDEQDRLLGVGGVVRDVSRRMRLEREQSRLLHDALVARAEAEAAGVRTDDAREEAERNLEAAERSRARMAVLADAGRRMAQSMDWETTLQSVTRSVVPAIADWCSLTVVEPNGHLRVHAIAHSDPARERLAWELVERYPDDPDAPSGAGHVVRTGELQATLDIDPETIRAAARDPEHLRLLENLLVRHVVIAPLPSPRGVVGALTFVLGESGRRFAEEDLQLIRSLAARAALHLENARLYTERSSIAEALQATLLPPELPEVPGADLAAHYRPAGDQNKVGGDFYDVFAVSPGAWTAVVGDVSGKGASAAALTALARHTLRATTRTHDDPASNLRLLNATFHDDTAPRDFCSVVYARICPSPEGFDVRFANGGHLAPILLRADGTVEAVETGRGPIVGAIADARYVEATISLARGDTLLLYTDGVTEVRTNDVALGERQLRATLAAHAGATAAELVEAVARTAVELQERAPRDDIALLAFKVDSTTVES